jgi:hypothetical protein
MPDGIRHRLLLCLLLAVPTPVLAQSEELLKAEAWEGTFSFHTQGSGTESAYSRDTSWAYDGRVQGSFVLDKFVDDAPPTWSGHWNGTAALHWKAQVEHEPDRNCVQDEHVESDGPVVNKNPRNGDIDLRLHRDSWEIRIWRNLLPSTDVERCVFGDGHVRTERVAITQVIPFDSVNHPYPASGTTLDASYTVNSNLTGSMVPPQLQLITWQGEMHVRPQGDLILEVESPAYDNWRPSATVAKDGSAGPGMPIEFTATLKHKSGKPAGVVIEWVKWELVDTSREPGIAINYPRLPPGGSDGYDLQFQPLAKQTGEGANLQRITSAVIENGTDRARIIPFDWGGWSVLKVTAKVRNGPEVVGRYKGSSEDNVRLPKRSADSFIADSWKRDSGAKGADDADDDDSPMGDGQKPDGFNGDGLTLYEEYRGWYEQGAHRSGSPKVKDYFVYNEAGETGRDGERLLRAKSGLAVHELLASEFDRQTRVINRNHAKGPHVVDQHGVWMKYDFANEEGISIANGGPGTPGAISYIGIAPELWDVNTPYHAAQRGSVVAHELLHAVNVKHHGENDPRQVTWSVRHGILIESLDTNDPEAWVKIRVLEESGNDVTQRWIMFIGEGGHQLVEIGLPNREHSGVEDCMMRYHIAHIYPKSGHWEDLRYWVEEPQASGVNLCRSSDGVDFNKSDRLPQSRYFSAAQGRGNCASQIRVTDRGTTPR